MSQIMFNAPAHRAGPANAAGVQLPPAPAGPAPVDDDDSVAGEEDPGAALDLPPAPVQPGPAH